VLACLAKQPERRPTSMAAIRADVLKLEIEPWTESEADAWWRERSAAVHDGRGRAAQAAGSPLTVAIDLAHRQAAGLEPTQMMPAQARS
jgi:hypothetical protein